MTLVKLLFITFLCIASTAYAADISFEERAPLQTDAQGAIDVVIDTKGETVNAIEGTIRLSSDAALRIHTGESIVSFWAEPPLIEDEGIRFSGIVPGGFSGRGTLFTIIMSPVRTAELTLTPEAVRLLRNDGAATAVVIEMIPATFPVRDTEGGGDVLLPEDTTPPEPFLVTVVNDQEIFEGKRMAVFATQDKQSGIAYYELQESNSRMPQEGAWKRTESPAELAPEGVYAHVFVRAADHAGNHRISRASEPVSTSLFVLLVLVILLTLGILLAYFIRTRR